MESVVNLGCCSREGIFNAQGLNRSLRYEIISKLWHDLRSHNEEAPIFKKR